MVKTRITQDKMLIGGEFVAGESTPLDIHNPATGEVLLKLPEAAVEQVKQAVVAADKAFEAWSQTTPKDRSLMLLKLADTSDAHAEELAWLESLNCGKPYLAVLNDEIPAISDCFRFFAGAVRSMTGALAGEYLAGHTSMIRRDPVRVVASTVPWNYYRAATGTGGQLCKAGQDAKAH